MAEVVAGSISVEAAAEAEASVVVAISAAAAWAVVAADTVDYYPQNRQPYNSPPHTCAPGEEGRGEGQFTSKLKI